MFSILSSETEVLCISWLKIWVIYGFTDSCFVYFYRYYLLSFSSVICTVGSSMMLALNCAWQMMRMTNTRTTDDISFNFWELSLVTASMLAIKWNITIIVYCLTRKFFWGKENTMLSNTCLCLPLDRQPNAMWRGNAFHSYLLLLGSIVSIFLQTKCILHKAKLMHNKLKVMIVSCMFLKKRISKNHD